MTNEGWKKVEENWGDIFAKVIMIVSCSTDKNSANVKFRKEIVNKTNSK